MNRRIVWVEAVALFVVLLSSGDNLRPPRSVQPKSPERSGALEALDFWTRARAYPQSDIPSGEYFKAFLHDKTLFKQGSRRILSATQWDPIGPLNLHGRSISVAVNHQNTKTVYLGTASGGLWRSHTGGAGGDWQQVPLGFPALGISSIAIVPADSMTMYIGTGEVYRYGGALGGLSIRTTRGSYGIGILKTTNGGATWTKSLDWTYNQQRGVGKIAFNPLNSNTLYAATTEGV